MSIADSTYKAINDARANSGVGILRSAIDGDIEIALSPATTTRAATTAAFSRDVNVRLQTSAGAVHSWYNGTLAISAADTSSAGTISIEDSATEVTLVNGEGSVTLNGNAADWLAGRGQVETIAVTDGCSTAGDLTVAVTAAGMSPSPKSVTVAVTTDDNTTDEVAAKVRAALAADATVGAFFTVGGSNSDIVLTKNAKAANDATLAIAFTVGSTGVTVGSSTNTTAGVAPETNTLTVAKNSSEPLLSNVASATSVETIV